MAYGSKFIAFQLISKGFEGMVREKQNKLKKQSTANKAAVTYVDKWIQDNFKTDGKKAHGREWKELAPSTLLWKANRKRKPTQNPQILRDTGYLKDRWKHLFSHSMAAIQSGVPYGVYHDSDLPRRKLPQRKILPRYQQVWPDIKKIFRLFLRKVLK